MDPASDKEVITTRLINMNTDQLEKFFKVIDKCEGRVELVSDDGDLRINLKSTIAKYFSLAQIFSAGAELIPSLDLVVYNEEDAMRLLKFTVSGGGWR